MSNEKPKIYKVEKIPTLEEKREIVQFLAGGAATFRAWDRATKQESPETPIFENFSQVLGDTLKTVDLERVGVLKDSLAGHGGRISDELAEKYWSAIERFETTSEAKIETEKGGRKNEEFLKQARQYFDLGVNIVNTLLDNEDLIP